MSKGETVKENEMSRRTSTVKVETEMCQEKIKCQENHKCQGELNVRD
jgi:hypothetical protein